tara:strand:+ start:1720 stop:1989 length:270 start_codon:yes stop_codon:yes gene_type:complete
MMKRGGLTRAALPCASGERQGWRTARWHNAGGATLVAQRRWAEGMGLRSPENANHVVRGFEAMDDSELADQIWGWKDLKMSIDPCCACH